MDYLQRYEERGPAFELEKAYPESETTKKLILEFSRLFYGPYKLPAPPLGSYWLEDGKVRVKLPVKWKTIIALEGKALFRLQKTVLNEARPEKKDWESGCSGSKRDSRKKPACCRITIRGIVQGVGFRPFVFNLAIKYGLRRELGTIPSSGLALKEKVKTFDASLRFPMEAPYSCSPSLNCSCGDVLAGKISPVQCPQFGSGCTPAEPLGPCMVSSEGACAACYYVSDV